MADEAYHPLYLRGIAEFNRRNFFQSHEVWEELWLSESGPARKFYKGLIQAAVALHHLSRGNAHGATRLLAGSTGYLEAYRSRYLGLDVDGFLASLDKYVTTELEATGGGCPACVGSVDVPQIRLERSAE